MFKTLSTILPFISHFERPIVYIYVVCKLPLTPTNGKITVSDDGTTISYSCNSGYSLEGVSARKCQTDGSGWDESDPTCSKYTVTTSILHMSQNR